MIAAKANILAKIIIFG